MSEHHLETKDIFLLPNLWTSLQFITLPLMFYYALNRNLTLFTVFYVLSFFIDATDGMMARRLGLCSRLGMYLDTYIDFVMYAVVSVSLYLFIPDFLADYIVVLLVLFSVAILSRLISFIRFRQVLMLHLYTSKMMYFFLTLFVIHFFVTGNPSDILFSLLLIDAMLFIIEEFLIIVLLQNPREDMLTVLELLKNKKQKSY